MRNIHSIDELIDRINVIVHCVVNAVSLLVQVPHCRTKCTTVQPLNVVLADSGVHVRQCVGHIANSARRIVCGSSYTVPHFEGAIV